jgi:hypothetical protein
LLTIDGTYNVVVENNRLESSELILIVDTVAPDITVDLAKGSFNIISESATEQNVTYVLYKDGEVVDLVFDKKIKTPGNYVLEITDLAGNIGIVTWETVKVSNIWTIILIIIGGVILIAAIIWIIRVKTVRRIK